MVSSACRAAITWATCGVNLQGGRITMLTNPRVSGYVFNPVSFLCCHGPEGEPRCILVEVITTFGERLP